MAEFASDSVDTVVIGGGLAGCLAAITLARRNRRVVLLEAKSYPQHKVCGEFLSPECLPIFDEAGFLPALQALHPVIIRTARITAPDSTAWQTTFPAPGTGISRYALDAALAVYAASLGVEVCDGIRVNRIDGSLDDGFRLTAVRTNGTSTFRAKTVIAAHGKHSNLDRVLNRTFLRTRHAYVGLKRHFTGASLHDHLDLHVFPGGYCGMSDVEDGKTNVCLLVRQDVFQRETSNEGIDQFIGWMSEQNPYLHQWLTRATPLYDHWISIGQVTLVPKSPLEGDILLAGDAAGMIAPLAGDGMAMALQSGVLAANLIDRYLEHQLTASELKRQYARSW
ncbi:MAG TPA: NAD(P)/FAD-dependent oxidoreductase, partial [Phototrophicaceae bacterium]|nr:NAD(P)/FAD-dependent oxidoreductase [Phototrophicaceae bacterium]